ncbi:TetR/AcrR family transcriptional regulator [Spirosoma linguale]
MNYKRKKEPLESRQAVLEAAFELIPEIGLDKLTLDAVSKKAKLSKGGLLHHFPKKDALINALFADSLQKFSDTMSRAKRDNESFAITYLKAIVNDKPDPLQKRSMHLLMQAAIHNGSYRELLAQWYQKNVMSEAVNNSPAALTAILVADGIWYANLFGAYTLTREQKNQIIDLISNL